MATEPETFSAPEVAGAIARAAVDDVERTARTRRDGHCCARTAPKREWLTIHEASELIGVSPATLRRWSDAGEIKAFTTPGGHRRFARAAVLGLIPPDRRDRSNGRLGDIAERIARAYRRLTGGGASTWLDRLDEGEIAPFRELASGMAVAMLDLLEADSAGRDVALGRAETSAAAFGALAAARGASVAETLDAFLALRKPFLRELTGGACRQGFDARQTTDLLDTATEAIDRLLAAVIRGHQAGAEPRTTVVGGAIVAGAPIS